MSFKLMFLWIHRIHVIVNIITINIICIMITHHMIIHVIPTWNRHCIIITIRSIVRNIIIIVSMTIDW